MSNAFRHAGRLSRKEAEFAFFAKELYMARARNVRTSSVTKHSGVDGMRPSKNADSLRKLMVSEDKMVKFHYQKADDVQYSMIRDPESRMWGQTYEIYGKDVATPLQFWITDSVNRFVRAALYFDGTPNNDSLQPVIQYLKEDAMHLINTFAWKP